MDNALLYKLMLELRQQCQFSQMAWREIKSLIHGVDQERVMFNVHALLQHVEVIGRFLWPERDASSARGEALRKALEIPDDSPLKLSGLRGQLRAEDESFEDWLAGLDSLEYVDMNVMSIAAIGDFQPDSFHRNLDTDTFKFYWRGAVCDLRAVTDAVRKLESSLQTWLKTHNPW